MTGAFLRFEAQKGCLSNLTGAFLRFGLPGGLPEQFQGVVFALMCGLRVYGQEIGKISHYYLRISITFLNIAYGSIV